MPNRVNRSANPSDVGSSFDRRGAPPVRVGFSSFSQSLAKNRRGAGALSHGTTKSTEKPPAKAGA